MPEVLRLSRQVGDNIYELTVSWDTESFEDGTPRIALAASVASATRPNDRQSIEAGLTLEGRDDGSPDIVLRIADVEVVRLPLEDMVDESQIIDRIPGFVYGAGNPIVGCLIRAGLSSSVSGIIRCTRRTRDLRWYRARIRGIGQCLRANAGRMATGMTLRAARCIAFII